MRVNQLWKWFAKEKLVARLLVVAVNLLVLWCRKQTGIGGHRVMWRIIAFAEEMAMFILAGPKVLTRTHQNLQVKDCC